MTTTNHTLPKLHWRFPEAAKFGRVIPKDKLYSQAGVSAQLKQLFVEQVGQIKWAYKLAETTVNLAKTEQVDEIEVIHIKLKTNELDQKVLAAIDKAIPHPTLFVLLRGQLQEEQGITEIAYMAAHKQKAVAKAKENTKEKWQQSQYLQSVWIKAESIEANQLPTATHLQGLYEQLLDALLPVDISNSVAEKRAEYNAGINLKPQANEEPSSRSKKSIDEKLADLAEIEALNKQIKQVKIKRDKEKQFNRRLELNNQFKALKRQLAKRHNC
jgi:hypothetical protein